MLVAREEIRDLVARYNANGDTGRFAQVVELFAPDAVMEVNGATFTGPDEIATIFTGVRDSTSTATTTGPPFYVRHMTATHQIDLIDESNARGRCYYQVLTPLGLDHWGRYIDEYKVVDGRWRFARRRPTLDGHNPASVMAGGRGGGSA